MIIVFESKVHSEEYKHRGGDKESKNMLLLIKEKHFRFRIFHSCTKIIKWKIEYF